MPYYILIKKWTEHNGKEYPKGCTIGLSEQQAEAFAADGYILIEPSEKVKKVKTKKIKEDGHTDSSND
tara:strand:+ start:7434 stop:7637 length:204 start_codon:yes stop_codon:yes gene_type:complete